MEDKKKYAGYSSTTIQNTILREEFCSTSKVVLSILPKTPTENTNEDCGQFLQWKKKGVKHIPFEF